MGDRNCDRRRKCPMGVTQCHVPRAGRPPHPEDVHTHAHACTRLARGCRLQADGSPECTLRRCAHVHCCGPRGRAPAWPTRPGGSRPLPGSPLLRPTTLGLRPGPLHTAPGGPAGSRPLCGLAWLTPPGPPPVGSNSTSGRWDPGSRPIHGPRCSGLCFFSLPSPKDMFTDFQRESEQGEEREKHQSAASHTRPDRESNPQSKCVP